jgi:hypothetical protein
LVYREFVSRIPKTKLNHEEKRILKNRKSMHPIFLEHMQGFLLNND